MLSFVLALALNADVRALEEKAAELVPHVKPAVEAGKERAGNVETGWLKRKLETGFEPVIGTTKKKAAKADERETMPYIFVSHSIPVRELRSYAKQLDAIGGGYLVLRGCIGGCKKIVPTVNWAAEVLRRDQSCSGPNCSMYNAELIIDPVLFEEYGIKRVPAFITDRENKTHCNTNNNELSKVVYGLVPLRYALDEVERLTDKKGTKE
jgi:type-F conjugative transfer system pilin assembly protein TrbC